MNSIKTIIISVAFTFLTVALFACILFHNFTMSLLGTTDPESFREAIVKQALVESLQQLQDSNTDEDDLATNEPEDTNTDENTPTDNSDVDTDKADNEMLANSIIYEDNYIAVKYVKQEQSIFGPTVKFLVESKTTETIDVSFTDVYIDGYKVELCGIYVSELGAGKKSFETLYLYESDYENFTSFPSLVEFTIKVMNSDTLASLAESQIIYINIV